MKKYLTIVAALLTLNILSANAQTESTTELQTEAELAGLHCGDTVIITATAADGFTFLYWADDESKTIGAEREIVIDATTKLDEYVAVFTQNKTYALAITVNDSDMGSVVGGTGKYEAGTDVTLTAKTSSDCYKFKEWRQGTKVVGTDADLTITVSADEDANAYEAVFEQVEFTVKVSAKVGEQLGGGKVTIARKTVE